MPLTGGCSSRNYCGTVHYSDYIYKYLCTHTSGWHFHSAPCIFPRFVLSLLRWSAPPDPDTPQTYAGCYAPSVERRLPSRHHSTPVPSGHKSVHCDRIPPGNHWSWNPDTLSCCPVLPSGHPTVHSAADSPDRPYRFQRTCC